jgi:hypothetical protein
MWSTLFEWPAISQALVGKLNKLSRFSESQV